jgi:nucleoside-diphosphate-sugar epimerase
MNIFLTGASGYIGRRVAEKLQAAGHQILGLARSDHAVQWMQDQGITPHRGDLFDGPSLTQAALLTDGVIHLGAAVGPAWAEGDRIAVHALLDALADSGKPFIYTSGTPIYVDTSLTVVDEDAPMNPPPFFAWRPRVEQHCPAASNRLWQRGRVFTALASPRSAARGCRALCRNGREPLVNRPC